jgi:hypothetical protein
VEHSLHGVSDVENLAFLPGFDGDFLHGVFVSSLVSRLIEHTSTDGV